MFTDQMENSITTQKSDWAQTEHQRSSSRSALQWKVHIAWSITSTNKSDFACKTKEIRTNDRQRGIK